MDSLQGFKPYSLLSEITDFIRVGFLIGEAFFKLFIELVHRILDLLIQNFLKSLGIYLFILGILKLCILKIYCIRFHFISFIIGFELLIRNTQASHFLYLGNHFLYSFSGIRHGTIPVFTVFA